MEVRDETSQKAWKLREDGKVMEALAIWHKLYFKYIQDENWERTISTLIDITICWKIKGEISGNRVFFETALATLQHIKHLADEKNIALRNDYDYHLAGIETALGVYEKAITSYEHYLSTSKTPEEEANILAHVGYAKAKTGDKEGIDMLRKAIDVFEQSTHDNTFQNKDVYSIWKLGAKLKLAQVISDKDEARLLVSSVYKEAKDKNLGARKKQAETLLKEYVKD